jgi:isoleucyl-tRNA synthetase
MSSFYLDIIKDRLYTTKKNSIERRSAQTVMYEILSSLVRILAPMTCYTAEEIWKYMPHKKGENTESVMLEFYPKTNTKYDNKDLEAKWDKYIKIRDEVAKKLEVARANKEIGLSLEAKVILYANGAEYEFIKGKEELLKEIFIVSDVEIRQGNNSDAIVDVNVEKASGEKCERCWMYSTTVGQDKEHPHICHRCCENLK